MENEFRDWRDLYKYRVNEWVYVQLIGYNDDTIAEIEVDRTSRVFGWFDCIDEVPKFLGYDLEKIKKQDHSTVWKQDDIISFKFKDERFCEQYLYECLAEKGIVPQEKPENWDDDYWVLGYQHCDIFEEEHKVIYDDDEEFNECIEPKELDE